MIPAEPIPRESFRNCRMPGVMHVSGHLAHNESAFGFSFFYEGPPMARWVHGDEQAKYLGTQSAGLAFSWCNSNVSCSSWLTFPDMLIELQPLFTSLFSFFFQFVCLLFSSSLSIALSPLSVFSSLFPPHVSFLSLSIFSLSFSRSFSSSFPRSLCFLFLSYLLFLSFLRQKHHNRFYPIPFN